MMSVTSELQPETRLVVPAFNEASRMDPAPFLKALEDRPWLHLLLVDDGSTDATAAILADIAAAHERASLITLETNMGKAAAVHRGLGQVLRSDAARIGYWDSDLATPFAELDGMMAEMNRLDAFLVMGSRVRLLGRKVTRHGSRHYLGRAFATGASLALGLPVYDTQCGAKLFRNDMMARTILEPPFRSRWMFDVEILARIARYDEAHGTCVATTAVVEHPLGTWTDVHGSKVRARDGLRAGLDLARIALWRRFG